MEVIQQQMERLLTVSTILSLGLIVVVLYSLRRAHIRVEYSVSWLAAGLVVYVLSQWGSALHWLGRWLGISYPPAVLASIAMCVFLMVLYRFSTIISHLRDNNIALAQKVAILDYQIRQLQESHGEARR